MSDCLSSTNKSECLIISFAVRSQEVIHVVCDSQRLWLRTRYHQWSGLPALFPHPTGQVRGGWSHTHTHTQRHSPTFTHPCSSLREQLMFPMQFVGLLGRFDLECSVSGGGRSSQAGALRLAISRALLCFLSEGEVENLRQGQRAGFGSDLSEKHGFHVFILCFLWCFFY